MSRTCLCLTGASLRRAATLAVVMEVVVAIVMVMAVVVVPAIVMVMVMVMMVVVMVADLRHSSYAGAAPIVAAHHALLSH